MSFYGESHPETVQEAVEVLRKSIDHDLYHVIENNTLSPELKVQNLGFSSKVLLQDLNILLNIFEDQMAEAVDKAETQASEDSYTEGYNDGESSATEDTDDLKSEIETLQDEISDLQDEVKSLEAKVEDLINEVVSKFDAGESAGYDRGFDDGLLEGERREV